MVRHESLPTVHRVLLPRVQVDEQLCNVSGYWGFDWADSYVKVGSVYPTNASIKLVGNNDQGIAIAGVPEKYLSLAKLQAGSDPDGPATVGLATSSKYPIKPKARVMVVNALSELE
jgi:hypothetical protein